MNAAKEHALSCGRAEGGDPSALQPLIAILEGLSIETEEECISCGHLELSACEAMRSIAHLWIDERELANFEQFCEYHENCVGSGMGWRHYVNTICVAVLNNRRHLHVDVQYGYDQNKVYFKSKKALLEVEDE